MYKILIYVTYINEVENYLKFLFTHKYWEILSSIVYHTYWELSQVISNSSVYRIR